MSYNPGTATAGDWIFIETVTISNDATIEMDLSGAHDVYVVHIDNLIPATNSTRLEMRFSVDAGSTFLSGASDYRSQMLGAQANDAVQISYSTSFSPQDAMVISNQLGNDGMSNTGVSSLNGFVFLHNTQQSTLDSLVTFEIVYLKSEQDFTPIGKLTGHKGRGALIANVDTLDAVQFLSSSGNLTSGRVSLYGIDDA